MNKNPVALIVEIYQQPIIGRLFCIGDLHGNYDLLIQKLNDNNFDYSIDLLVSVGDLVDRGDQSLRCLELLKEPWFKAVRGNHEQYCIDSFNDPRIIKNHICDGGQWFHELSVEDQKYSISLIEQYMPIALEINYHGHTFGFVHAHVEENNWEDFKNNLSIQNPSKRSHIDMALWGRERIQAHSSDTRYEHVAGIHTVFFGHTIVKNPLKRFNCFWIDTGAYYTGRLTLLCIDQFLACAN